MLCFLCPVVSLLFLLGELVYNPASFPQGIYSFATRLKQVNIFLAETRPEQVTQDLYPTPTLD